MSSSLLDLPLHVLEELERAALGERLRAPVTELGLRGEGLHALLEHLEALACYKAQGALQAAVSLACEARRREQAEARPQVVWSGPEPIEGRARLTGIVLEQLFERAEREVFIAGYTFEKGEEVLAPLHEVMQRKGIEVDIVIDCSAYKVKEQTSPEVLLDKVVARFWKKIWSFGEPKPRLFHDPRTLAREPSYRGEFMFPPVSMHAKCVIVDRRHVLVGSANFTKRARARNIEVGALLDDEGFAEGLLFQWRASMSRGYIVEVSPRDG